MAAQDNAETVEAPRIPDHKLVRRIGKGAYGEVWLGRNVMGAYRGIKIVHRRNFDHDRPFDREFEGTQRFEPISRTHPGFVSILHVGPAERAPYFYYIMEVADDIVTGPQIQAETYCARTLFEEIQRRGRLPARECIQIGIALSSALAHLHRQGLVHRDIKPSNIIFINGTPRLADIGLVAVMREKPSYVGTPGFIPDEGPGTVLSDIYALGKVLYQMSVAKAVDQFPSMPTSLIAGEDVPRFLRLNEIILLACEEDPRKRQQSADELHDALEALQREDFSAVSPEGVGTAAVPKPAPSAPRRRIALLYKANVEPDRRLLQLLYDRLTAQGVEVFFDKHLTVGVQWAREIENKIREADAVVVLLSETSVQSEMVAYEVEIAHEAAQQQGGRPLRLPVRVHFGAPLPPALSPFLDPLQHFLWTGPADDERLVVELTRALETTQKAAPPEARPKIEPIGGAVDLASQFYIVRPTDEEFRKAIVRWDSIVLVKGARQMGKTSLLARGLQEARQAGAHVVLTDFQKLSLQHLESAELFFLALGGFLADQLDLVTLPEDSWDKRRSANTNFERFLRREVLAKTPGHLVWGLDEVDRLFTCSFGSEVFGLFRSWHNERALDPSGPWSRLTLAIAYATEAHLFITDINQSPFNVGTRLALDDFSPAQIDELNWLHGGVLATAAEREQFFNLTGGQPYLVRRGLNELAAGSATFADFARQAASDEGIFGDHLRRMLVLLAKDPELMEVVRGILRGEPCPNATSFYRLRSAGLIRGDAPQLAHFRCDIYAAYLRRHLL